MDLPTRLPGTDIPATPLQLLKGTYQQRTKPCVARALASGPWAINPAHNETAINAGYRFVAIAGDATVVRVDHYPRPLPPSGFRSGKPGYPEFTRTDELLTIRPDDRHTYRFRTAALAGALMLEIDEINAEFEKARARKPKRLLP